MLEKIFLLENLTDVIIKTLYIENQEKLRLKFKTSYIIVLTETIFIM